MTEINPNVPAAPPSLTPSGRESATATLIAADAMHRELLRQCAGLMGAEAGTDKAADLGRISKLVSEYEDVRWPIDQTPIQK